MSITSNVPVFSVVIACFNGAKTLNRAIESILKQTYDHYEIIVVDDGSTDDTASVVAQYGDKVRYFFQENAGVSAARNRGAVESKGNWLAFLDADDWYYPERLQWHVEMIIRNPDVDFLIGDYHFGSADGKVIKRAIEGSAFGKKLLDTVDESSVVVLDQTGIGSLIPAYFGHTSTFSVPRKTFLDLGGYAESYSIGEDLHLLIRLCAISQKAGVVCKPMAFYAVHDDGLMRSIGIEAQFKSVATLLSLKDEMRKAPAPVKEGYLKALLNHRFDWAVALLKNGKHLEALRAFLPSLMEFPSLKSLKMFLSIVKG